MNTLKWIPIGEAEPAVNVDYLVTARDCGEVEVTECQYYRTVDRINGRPVERPGFYWWDRRCEDAVFIEGVVAYLEFKPYEPDERRAPVQSFRPRDGREATPPGTIAWSEHLEVWELYAERFGRCQSAERIAERGGFGYGELTMLLGRPPKTWRAR